MADDTVKDVAAEKEFSAAAPPDPESAGVGETNFADAEAPPAGAPREAEPEQDEAAKFRELAMRKQAEFENYRKRMARENAQAAERGAARLAKELLPALDHLELSLKGAEGHADADVIRGFALVRDELLVALGKCGIEAFSPEGEPFDPNEHEAMVQQPSEEAESGTVLEVYQQGFRLNGQILRPARVVVAA
ncbi:MAG: nucleotide exchange factor GrpE [Solirubrobacteraceae bacterium]